MTVSDPNRRSKSKPATNEARLSFRTTRQIKETVERGATLAGKNVSNFAIEAAYQRAVETIRAHEVTYISSDDQEAFLSALENPPAPTDKLKKAFADHAALVHQK